MTTETIKNDKNNEMVGNTELYVDYNDISSIFKKLKEKGFLNETIHLDTYETPNEKLLDTGDFIDKVIYHRIKKHYSIPTFARKLGLDRDTYYQYENRTFKMNKPDIAKKMIDILDIEYDDLPDYIKFIINDPIEKVKKFMEKYNVSRKEFSEKTNISLNTFNRWFIEDHQISIKNFNKLKSYMGNEL